MNKSFKVVFSKARSALMVVNEATSSIQAKGTKTVIAVAAAMVAGGACAAQWVDSPVKEDSIVRATTTWDKVAETNSFVWTVAGETKTPAPFLAVSGAEKEFTQQLWVTGTGAAAQASGIWTSGEKAKLVNKGTIYVTTGKDGVTWQNAALGADAGATVTNAGKIVVKNAHGMRIGTSTALSTIINDEAGAIYVEETGVGMELGGFGGSKAVNNGLISVGKKAETKGAYTFGVQFEKEGDTFTNNGTISAAGADYAILVKEDARKSTLNLEKTSNVDGLIAVFGKGTTINLNGTKDTLTITTSANTENSGTTINVNDGADVELTDGKGATFDAVRVNDGKLSASIWKVDNTFTSVTVEEDGIFNITKLNSRVDGEKIDLEKGIKGDRLLIARNQSIALNGGQLWAEGAAFTGTMKIGSSKQNSGSLTVSKGDYSFDSVQVYKNGALAVNGGTLTINDLDTEFGKTTVSGGTLTVTGDMKVGTADSVTVTTGELQANAKELFQVTGTGAEEKVNWNSKVTGITANGGYVTVLDAVELDAATIKQAVSQYGQAGLTFANLTVKLEEGTTDTGFDSGFGTAMLGQVVKVSGGTAALGAAKVGVGSLKVADTDKALSVTGDGTLLIGGLTGNVVNGVTQLDTMTVNEGTLQLGKDAADAGNVNVKALTVKNLNVTGSYTAADVSVTDKATVSGKLEADKLTVAAGATVAEGGVLAVDQVTGAGTVTVSSGAVLALGERVWQKAQTEGQALFAARVAEAGSYLPQVDATVNASAAGSFVTTNAQTGVAKATAAMAKAGVAYDAATNAVLYVDKTLGIGTAGKLTVSTLQNQAAAGEVAVGSNGIFVIDGSFINSADFVIDGAARLSSAASIVVDGLNSKGTVNLAKTWNSAGTNITFADNNAFLKGTVTKTAADAATNPNSAVLTVVTDTAAFGTNTELSDIVDEHLGTDTNAGLRNLLLAVGNEQGDFIQNGLLTSRGERALEEVFALPVTAGTYNVAYDAAEQVTGAIQRHNTAVLQGTGVWADVYYSSNAGKEIYGGQGYSADIYGGVIGVDYTATCGAKMGVALTVGTGDADSEKSVSKFGNDADFYGLSVYAGKNVGDTSLYVSADASYLWLDNDITGNVAGASAAESIDSSVFTIGLRADWAAYAGDVMSVTPHVGLRYTNIDVDSYRGLDTGAMDLVEMPVGVKVAGNFETAGWKVTPAVDFTVVPQVGDKQVDTVVGAVDVIDNLYNTTLGVSAEYGNFTFGLNYRYGFGNNDRKNNSVNANVRYMF
mgnify:CR=1 FL=1